MKEFRYSLSHLTLSLAMGAGLICLASPAFGKTPPDPSITELSTSELNQERLRLSDAKSGSLLFKTSDLGEYVKAPNVATDVKIDIAGPVIRIVLSQTFQNLSEDWVEGIYVFPLPENAAVDRLRVFVGERMIEGKIEEKKKAKKIYEQAKSEGKKASLVEQERPNMFTASVANIGPHETIAIQIEYQDKTHIRGGSASLTFPMTVAPRYSPSSRPLQIADADGKAINVVLDPVLDRDRISPPVRDPQLEPIEYKRLPVTMEISLDAGFDLETVKSAYHHINVDKIDSERVNIRLQDGDIPANRDFKLTWTALPTQAPQHQLFKQTFGDDTYFMSLVMPPQAGKNGDIEAKTERHRRETIFVIDTSGSMDGTSIREAKAALKLGLSQLGPQDRFNIIRFSSDYSSLFEQPRAAGHDHIQRALSWVNRLHAKGGTEMKPAMIAALQNSDNTPLDSSPSDGNPSGDSKSQNAWLRQVIFITDGAIGNERELFSTLKDRLGDARLFPVGIGSAPNHYFMSRAATFGRGTSVHIGSPQEVQTEMGTLFKALSTPVLTNLKFDTALQGEAYPSRLPDLYTGEPIVSLTKIKTNKIPQAFNFKGNFPNQNWEKQLSVKDAKPAKGLSVLWARRKIQDLEEQRFTRDTAESIDQEILTTALDHHIISRLTSLVAVDISPSRNVNDPLLTKAVPTQLPQGWDFAKVARSAHTELRARPNYTPALAPAPPNSSAALGESSHQIPLPATASPHIFWLWLGTFFLAGAALLSRMGRRRHGGNAQTINAQRS